MTFKAPSASVYFFSLIIAAVLAAVVFWVLQAQNLSNNGMVTLVAGLFIGHLIASCTQTSTTTKAATAPVNGSDTTGESLSLYVGNLAYRVQRDELRELFENYGKVNSVRIMIDRATRRPRGYAFVEMDSQGAVNAIKQLDNTEFCGRALRVSEAKQRA